MDSTQTVNSRYDLLIDRLVDRIAARLDGLTTLDITPAQARAFVFSRMTRLAERRRREVVVAKTATAPQGS